MSNTIFSYTHRDYEDSRKEGLSKIPVLSKGNWTDLNSTDPGIIILDYVHALVDMIQYYQDHQALESFITTAKERENIFRLAKQLSYEVRSAKGATCEVTFTSPIKYDHSIKIPEGTIVSTAKNIKYVTMKDAYLPANSTSVNVMCIQGVWKERVYEGTGISRFSNETGAANQVLNLPSTTVDVSTISIKDNSGRSWTKVDHLCFSSEVDRAYQVDINPDNTVSIRFGDGNRGVVPQTTDILTIKYLVTDAENGRIGANSITTLEREIYDIYEDMTYVELMPTNLNASVGGSSVQTSADIRDLAPGVIKAQNRAITISDFENLAKMVDGVVDAKAYDINNNPDLCLHHEVKVLIVPEDYNSSLDILKSNVYNYLYDKMIPPTALQVLTPSLINIDISLTVSGIKKENNDEMEYEIREAVSDYFDDISGSIGENFYPTDLSAKINSKISNIKYIASIYPNSVVEIAPLSVARLGNLEITIL